MKKMSLILIACGFILTGCATTSDDTPQIVKNINAVNNKNGFSSTLVSSPAMVKDMGDADQVKLVQLIATSAPQQKVTWKSDAHSTTFEFTSLSVALDDQGRPCRTYKIRTMSFGAERNPPTITACRLDNGNWRGV